MELIPENLSGVVVLNAVHACGAFSDSCGACEEYAGGIRNWLLTYEVPYLIVDLQDEKEVCPQFLTELVNLRRRLRCPFYFVGVMDRARAVLDAFNVTRTAHIFQSAHEAVEHLREETPVLVDRPLREGIPFGEVITIMRTRNQPGVAAGDVAQDAAPQDDF